jgi:hypothetical protein
LSCLNKRKKSNILTLKLLLRELETCSLGLKIFINEDNITNENNGILKKDCRRSKCNLCIGFILLARLIWLWIYHNMII